MDARLELHKKLLDIANTHALKVYFQPPANISITYPCIIYEYKSPRTQNADNMNYLSNMGYQISVITKEPDTSVVKELQRSIPSASFNDVNIIDNKYHYVLSCYTTL